MIYLTGDTHGMLDMNKVLPSHWPCGQTLSRDDYLVILGDYGAIWGDGNVANPQLSTRDHLLLTWYEAQPWTTLFLDGNHENHDLIDSFETSELFGGKVQVTPGFPHVIHLMRGEVYDLPAGGAETLRCLVMGGAESVDKAWRTVGESWWAREMPSQAEYANCAANLERVGFAVDYVLTHDLPHDGVFEVMSWVYPDGFREPKRNELTAFLQWVYAHIDKTRLKGWYAGHHHVDKDLSDGLRHVLFQSIVPLGA